VHFGRGFEPIDDKMGAILPYRFHLVLENSVLPNYWTEKLADALSRLGLPGLFGCPNVGDYLPAEALLSINDLDVGHGCRAHWPNADQPLDPRREAALAEARIAC